jgi:hypothetical protein
MRNAVGPGDNQSIALAQIGKAIGQERPVMLDAARLLFENGVDIAGCLFVRRR